MIRVWAGGGKPYGKYAECEAIQNEHFNSWERLDFFAEETEMMSTPFMRSAAKDKNRTVLLTAVRWWALWKYGGVYMDYDVKPLKDFTPLLNTQIFIGYEQEPNYICEAVVGAVAHCEAVSRIMWNFPWGQDVSGDTINYGPPMTSRLIAQMPDAVRSTITIHKKDVFFPFLHGQTYRETPDSYAAHLFLGEWLHQKE